MLNKTIIIFNTIIPLLSCYKLSKCMFISLTVENKMDVDAEIRNIRWLLTEDRKLYERAVRAIIAFMLLANSIVFLNNLTRIISNWLPYGSVFIQITSIVFSLVMLAKAHISLMLFRGDDLKAFRNFNEFFKEEIKKEKENVK